jgi:hypothetical protein
VTGIGSVSIFRVTAEVKNDAALRKGFLGRLLTRASSATNIASFRRLVAEGPLRATHKSRLVIGTATSGKKTGTLKSL